MADIQLYDATLRDGMGGGGLTLTAEEKLRVVHALDALGVDMIEAGFPASNPKEQQLFDLLAAQSLEHAEIVAFGMTRRRDVLAEDDEGLRVLAECFAPVCTLVGKASLLHVEKVVRVSREENLQMIGDSIAFLVRAGKRALFDAEHFFDGFAEDPGYALDCLRAAADAGAERVVLCDTNGGSLPPQVRTALAVVREALPGAALGIHCHDDSGCAVANTLTAVEAGATQVQGTVNGVGERTGNANLITIVADLQLKMGAKLLAPERLARLTETAHFVDELLNRAPNPAQPYVGKHAFAHKAGMHAAGVRADAQTFEHVAPAVVGNSRDVLISELSGKGTVVEKAAAANIDLQPASAKSGASLDIAQRVVDRVKELEHEGFQFEAADGSFELLMRKEAGAYEPLFRLESWRVLVEKRADGKVVTEATIKIWLGQERYVRTAEGNGPVNALDAALRDAIGELHPHLRDIELVNFKVRILDETKGTGAVTRVLIDASDGHDTWGTIGVSENVIAASWDALVDSLEYGMQPGRQPQATSAPDAPSDAVAAAPDGERSEFGRRETGS
jgi:2-isopropylmalate synthase